MHWSTTEGRSPRLSARRVKSARELYRPAIKDLSEQAGWNTDGSEIESTIQPITQVNHSDRPSTNDCPSNANINGVKAGDATHDVQDTNRLMSPLCIAPRLPNVYEEQYRRRVVISARQRHRLTSMKRARSVEPCGSGPQTIPYSSSQYTENDGNIINLVVTNSLKASDEPAEKRTVPSRSQCRSNKSCTGTLLSDGSKGQMNGFHHHLVTTHPKTKQRISMWLTNGFKVQSFRTKPSRASTACVTRNYNKTVNRRKLSDRKLIEDLKKIRLDENEDIVVFDHYEHKRLHSARSVNIDSISLGLSVNGIRQPFTDEAVTENKLTNNGTDYCINGSDAALQNRE